MSNKFECALGYHDWYQRGCVRQCILCKRTEVLDIIKTKEWVYVATPEDYDLKEVPEEVLHGIFGNIYFDNTHAPITLSSSSKDLAKDQFRAIWNFDIKKTFFPPFGGLTA